MQGYKYQIALAQITTSLGSSKTSMALAMMSVKLMNKGTRRADVVEMVMAQVSLKAALKKWGREADESVGYGVTQNLLLQDNTSSILLERNGKASSGKWTRHINI